MNWQLVMQANEIMYRAMKSFNYEWPVAPKKACDFAFKYGEDTVMVWVHPIDENASVMLYNTSNWAANRVHMMVSLENTVFIFAGQTDSSKARDRLETTQYTDGNGGIKEFTDAIQLYCTEHILLKD